MTRSESIKEIAAALAKAQGQIEAAKKDSENPHFKAKYADLASVWEACRAALSANGIAVVQAPGEFGEGRIWLTTELLHSSGEWISEVLQIPLGKVDAHGLGSAITYGRRYSLAAMVGVAPDDDDGNAAVKHGTVDSTRVSDQPREKRNIPFPQGPCKGIQELKTVGREFWRDVEACDDIDQLASLLASQAPLVRQLKEALPDWWDGGQRGNGENYEGLGEVITRVQSGLEANRHLNPLVSGQMLDTFTADTLRSMVRYIKCDRKIARYLRIDEKHVRRARTYVTRRGRSSLNSAGVVRRAASAS